MVEIKYIQYFHILYFIKLMILKPLHIYILYIYIYIYIYIVLEICKNRVCFKVKFKSIIVSEILIYLVTILYSFIYLKKVKVNLCMFT